jgi:hypothetical protein
LNTDELIGALADEAPAVRPLRRPWLRALAWAALGLPPALAVIFVHGLAVPLRSIMTDWRMLIEEVAILATALTAALAAFRSIVPGSDRRFLWLPLLPLAVWLVTLGAGCVADVIRLGPAGLALRVDSECFGPMVLIGIIPTVSMVMMLRRGAPLMPRATLALGALAVAALANFCLTLFHEGDVSIMVLVWHFGFIVVVSALAAWLGPHVLSWSRLVPARFRDTARAG